MKTLFATLFIFFILLPNNKLDLSTKQWHYDDMMSAWDQVAQENKKEIERLTQKEIEKLCQELPPTMVHEKCE